MWENVCFQVRDFLEFFLSVNTLGLSSSFWIIRLNKYKKILNEEIWLICYELLKSTSLKIIIFLSIKMRTFFTYKTIDKL